MESYKQNMCGGDRPKLFVFKRSITLQRVIFYMCLSHVYIFCASQTDNQWAHIYSHVLTSHERAEGRAKKVLIVSMTSIPAFTQLIFSWNAVRPHKGYFSFEVQARQAGSGMWSSWHKAIEWGAGKQSSYVTASDGIAHYVHVRFEMVNKKHGDGYRIRIKAHDGADLNTLYALTMSCADFSRFKPESTHVHVGLSTVNIDNVPRRSQFSLNHAEKKRLCSPTSCSMLIGFLTGKRCDIPLFSRNVYDSVLDTYGNWQFNMAQAFNAANALAWYDVVRCNGFRDVHACLMQGTPVAVSVRGALAGAPQGYAHGHLLVVVGYDASTKKVICHDPAFKRDRAVVHAYDLYSFLRAWECSRRLMYRMRIR